MFGVSSMTASLKKVAVMKPGEAILNANLSKWNYGPLFDAKKITEIHSKFVNLLKNAGVEIFWMPENSTKIADAIFTYDASLMTPSGAILMSPGKVLRRGEQNSHRQFYSDLKIPEIGEVVGEGTAEAGDTLWLDEETLVIGNGFRTNLIGIKQIQDILRPNNIKVHFFDLPVYKGKGSCLHLMSLISLVDTKVALVCLPFLPVGLLKLLIEKQFKIIPAPYSEFENSGTLSVNVLAIRPKWCVMLDGIPKTKAILEDAGIKVEVFSGDSLCIACEGGPTCLTRPLFRKN